MRLEIGTREKRGGYITIDGQAGATYCATVPPLPDEVMDYTFERVEAYHFWEHLYLWEAQKLAREIYSILEDGGRLILELPDLAKCCEMVVHPEKVPHKDEAPYHPDPRFTLWGIYGAQSDPKHIGNVFQAHKWGYTPESLSQLLTEAGFRRVEIKHITRGQIERDMRIEAVK